MDKGKLYLVATPIGNLGDISARALQVLSEVNLIAAEDTRVSGRLLKAFEIKRPLISYYEHNKALRGQELLRRLKAGENIALISDAGMPGISDPGFDIVRLAISSGIETVIVPGPNAALSALVLSGLDSSRFVFEGFLPRVSGKRRSALAVMAQEQRTMIFYEAPHRLLATLTDMAHIFGENRSAAAGRELTKLHEEMIRGSLAYLLDHFQQFAPQGEFTLVIAGANPIEKPIPDKDILTNEMTSLINSGKRRKDAAKVLAIKYGMPVKSIYDLTLRKDLS
ncbi:MAG: 16S rRNA (cytidine(1402)-2'-O)-methyltransferase [Clostridiales bacterium]|nr:16S rRNA (cytidine(1402)-2'-O)-methyltransferase [Clostridiales bacterium]